MGFAASFAVGAAVAKQRHDRKELERTRAARDAAAEAERKLKELQAENQQADLKTKQQAQQAKNLEMNGYGIMNLINEDQSDQDRKTGYKMLDLKKGTGLQFSGGIGFDDIEDLRARGLLAEDFDTTINTKKPEAVTAYLKNLGVDKFLDSNGDIQYVSRSSIMAQTGLGKWETDRLRKEREANLKSSYDQAKLNESELKTQTMAQDLESKGLESKEAQRQAELITFYQEDQQLQMSANEKAKAIALDPESQSKYNAMLKDSYKAANGTAYKQAPAITEQINMVPILGQLESLKSDFKTVDRDAIDKVSTELNKYGIDSFKEWVGMDETERKKFISTVALDTKTKNLAGMIVKIRSGAAATDLEREFIETIIVGGNDFVNVDTSVAALDAFTRQTMEGMSSVAEAAWNSGDRIGATELMSVSAEYRYSTDKEFKAAVDKGRKSYKKQGDKLSVVSGPGEETETAKPEPKAEKDVTEQDKRTWEREWAATNPPERTQEAYNIWLKQQGYLK